MDNQNYTENNMNQQYQQQYQQNQQYQQQYQQPYQQPYMQLEEPVSIGNWIGSLILCCIPVVNFIMLIVWICTATNQSKKNWAIAQLILSVIGTVISIMICMAFYSFVMSYAAMMY